MAKDTIGFHPKPRESRPEDIYQGSVGKMATIGVGNSGIAKGVVKKTFETCLVIDNFGEDIVINYKDISMCKIEPLIRIPRSF